jgi:hypothetical protein
MRLCKKSKNQLEGEKQELLDQKLLLTHLYETGQINMNDYANFMEKNANKISNIKKELNKIKNRKSGCLILSPKKKKKSCSPKRRRKKC